MKKKLINILQRIGKAINNFLNLSWLPKKMLEYVHESPEVIFVFKIFLIAFVFVLFFDFAPINRKGYLGNLFAEFHGLAFDVLVFGILIVIFNRRLEKQREIKRWQEEIDDFRGVPEAMYRIVGNIKRLNRVGISKINLSNCLLASAPLSWLNLKEANLRSADLHEADLRWTNLELADFGEKRIGDIRSGFGIEKSANLAGANLTGANLTYADLNKVNMHGANFFRTNLTKADLCEADLIDAKNLTIEQL